MNNIISFYQKKGFHKVICNKFCGNEGKKKSETFFLYAFKNNLQVLRTLQKILHFYVGDLALHISNVETPDTFPIKSMNNFWHELHDIKSMNS